VETVEVEEVVGEEVVVVVMEVVVVVEEEVVVVVVLEVEEHSKNFHGVISMEKIKISHVIWSIIVSLHIHSFLLLCMIVFFCLSIISMVIFTCCDSNLGRGHSSRSYDNGRGDCHVRDGHYNI